MNDAQLKRCKILITELHELRKNTIKPKFNMGNWMCDTLSRMTRKGRLHRAIMEATKNPCSTAACLAGKAGLIPRIRRMGFKWDVLSGVSYLTGQAQAGFHYGGYTGDDAVKAFFGSDAFHDIFMDLGGIRTLLQGIRALERLVKAEEQFREDEDNYYYE